MSKRKKNKNLYKKKDRNPKKKREIRGSSSEEKEDEKTRIFYSNVLYFRIQKLLFELLRNSNSMNVNSTNSKQKHEKNCKTDTI